MQSANQDIRGFLSALMLDAASIASLARLAMKSADFVPMIDDPHMAAREIGTLRSIIESLSEQSSGLVALIDAQRSAALMEVNIKLLAQSIYDNMEGRLCEEVATHIDCEEVAAHIDCEEVANHIDWEEVATRIDCEELMGALSYSSLADEINISSLADEINIREVAQNIEASAIAHRMDASDIAQHIDASEVAAHIKLPDVDAKGITAKAVAMEIDLPSLASEIASKIDSDDILREMWQQGKCREIVDALAENRLFCQEIDARVAGSLAMKIEAKDEQFISRIGQAVDVGFLASALVHRPEAFGQIAESVLRAIAKRFDEKND